MVSPSLLSSASFEAGVVPDVEAALRQAVISNEAAGPLCRVDDGNKAELSARRALGAQV